MALKKCKECGNEISKKAKECPKCGEPQGPKEYSLGKLIMVLLLGWFLYAMFTTDYTSPTSTASSSSSSKSGSNTNVPSTPSLEVQSFNCVKEHSYVYVRGEVKNISSQKLENVMAVGEFRTKSGDLVKTEDALLEYNPIMPGQTSPYEAGGTDNPEITNCNVSFKHLFGTPISYKSKK